MLNERFRSYAHQNVLLLVVSYPFKFTLILNAGCLKRIDNILEKKNLNHWCLIVDDDPIFVEMLKQTLINKGFDNVLTAHDGAQAAKTLENHGENIQAISLDLNMPNEDGIGFLTSASKIGFEGEIFISSSERKATLESVLQLARMLGINCRESFSKPVNFDQLAERILNVDCKQHNIVQEKTDKHIIDLALNELRIEAYYQPRINLQTMHISGAEVLARIYDAQGNFLNTQEVIDHAERTGKIKSLTWKMLQNLVDGWHKLEKLGFSSQRLSVNINGMLLALPGFSAELVEFFSKSGVDPSTIILEITETGLPPEPAASLEAFTRFRMHGFDMAIDDFGTGYSNIENLKLFPFTELKIDKNFIANAQNDAFSRECVAASVRFARELSLRVVAEGIETDYHLQFAKSYAIDEAQGYLFARPLPLADYCDLLAAGNTRIRRSEQKIAS